MNYPINFIFSQNLPPKKKELVLQTYYKVMTIRQPIDRIWSAYNDKFVTGNPSFLSSYGRTIVQTFHPNDAPKSSRCGNNVTFIDFIQRIIHEQTTGIRSNPHWAPYYQLCDPCHLKYNLISSTESMKTDMNYLSNQLSIPTMAKSNSSFSDIEEAAHRAPILTHSPKAYGFKLSDVDFCFTLDWFKRSYWTSLINGGFIDESQANSIPYISNASGIVYSKAKNWTKVRKVLYKTAVDGLFKNKSFEEGYTLLKQRKSNIKHKHINGLPLIIKNQLYNLYWPDFSMYGYNKM